MTRREIWNTFLGTVGWSDPCEVQVAVRPSNEQVKLTGERRRMVGAGESISNSDAMALVGPAAYLN
jgi:hypothetical protein